MRIHLSIITALLLTFFVAGMSTGRNVENCSHKAMQMTNCTCAKHSAIEHEVHCSSLGQDCCMSGECGELAVAKDVALESTYSPLEFSGMIEKILFSPFTQTKITKSDRTCLFLPHYPSTPIYNLHCSFLI